MQFLLLARKGALDHEHLVYVTAEGHTECSVNSGHSHTVLLFQGDLGPDLHLGETDEHTHTTTTELPVEDLVIKPDRGRIAEVVQLFDYAKSQEEDSRKKAKEAKAFYKGEQWPEDIRTKLNEQQRAVLTINMVASMIDLLSGYFRRNRTDFRYKPVEHGDSKMADILFLVVKQILTKSGYHNEEVEVFEDQIKTGRGCFHVYLDYDEDIQGRLRVEHFPEDQVVFGPHQKKDGSDMEFQIRWSWHTMRELKALFPDHADDLTLVDSIYFADDAPQMDSTVMTTGLVNAEYLKGVEMIDRMKKSTRLMVCEEREYRTVYTFLDEKTGFSYDADTMPKERINDLKSMRSFVAIERKTFRLRESLVGGGVLLSDRYLTERPYNHFSVLPVYCYKDRTDFWGKIEFGKDPQRELNKRRSQLTDIMSRMVGTGYFIDDTTFEDHIQEDHFRSVAPRAGWVQKVADTSRLPVRLDPPAIPTGIIQADQMSLAAFREVTHVSQEMLGMDTRAESGVALMAKQRQGVLGNEFIFDNFAMTKRTLGKIIAQYVQRYYKNRMARILFSVDDQETLKIGGEPMGSYTPQMIEQLVNTQDALDYDVVVSESQFSATARDNNLAVLTVLAQSGMPIPPEFLLMFVDVAEKDKLLQAFQAEQQRATEKEDRKYQTEIQKTEIASQSRQIPKEPNLARS